MVQSGIKLVACLGNPGKEYEFTRHNAGFLLAERIMEGTEGGGWQEKFGALYSKRFFGEKPFYLVKPMSYMNNSGQPLRKVADYFRIGHGEILVCHDDLSIPFGSLRIRRGGSSGGHNGLKSVISAFSTDKIPRLKMGIGSGRSENRVSYVLGSFSKEEKRILKNMLERAGEAALACVSEGLGTAMNCYNGKEDD